MRRSRWAYLILGGFGAAALGVTVWLLFRPQYVYVWQAERPLPTAVNTPDEDYEPNLSFDGMSLTITRGKAGRNADLYIAPLTPEGVGEAIPIVSVNTPYDEIDGMLGADGNLYFYSDRLGGMGGYDLYVAPGREDGTFEEAVNLGPNINSGFNDYDPFLSPDGRLLFFSSNRHSAGSEQDYDLYVCWKKGGKWGSPKPLEGLNTEHNEWEPALDRSGLTLFFTSNRPGGLGGYDLYAGRFREEAGWSEPKNLGTAVNSEKDELDPFLAPDGEVLYYVSDREGGAGSYDVWVGGRRASPRPSLARLLYERVPQHFVLIGAALLGGLLLLWLLVCWWHQLTTLQKCFLGSVAVHCAIAYLFTLTMLRAEFDELTQKEATYVVYTDLPEDVEQERFLEAMFKQERQVIASRAPVVEAPRVVLEAEVKRNVEVVERELVLPEPRLRAERRRQGVSLEPAGPEERPEETQVRLERREVPRPVRQRRPVPEEVMPLELAHGGNVHVGLVVPETPVIGLPVAAEVIPNPPAGTAGAPTALEPLRSPAEALDGFAERVVEPARRVPGQPRIMPTRPVSLAAAAASAPGVIEAKEVAVLPPKPLPGGLVRLARKRTDSAPGLEPIVSVEWESERAVGPAIPVGGGRRPVPRAPLRTARRGLHRPIPPTPARVAAASMTLMRPTSFNPSFMLPGPELTLSRAPKVGRRDRISRVVWGTPVNLGAAINSSDEDYEPNLSADGRMLLFTRGGAGGHADIYVSLRRGGQWQKPEPFRELNSAHDDIDANLSAGGRVVFLYSNRPGGQGGYDLYVSEKRDGRWRKPVGLGPGVNSAFNDYDPFLSRDGRWLFFSSNRVSGSEDDYDLYRCERREDGSFGPARRLPFNTEHNEWEPAQSPDGLSLYFVSNRPGGEGGYDIWVSHLRNGRWQDPVNLGSGVNTGKDELDPALSADGITLLFVSNRGGGMGTFDIWQSKRSLRE